ncbi:MAG: Crp/Fnr family transcriptional regulator [Oscillospiraceae bacterium]|nr:Crp/Fnr family transcriptional regulator [Oscillospiraceae bacterium]
MEKYIPILKNTRLFSGIEADEAAKMLGCLQARVGHFKRGEYVFHRGEKPKAVCVLLSGELHLQHDDYWGNRNITGRVGVGEIFGESYAAPSDDVVMSDVIAVRDSEVIFFDVLRMLTVCSSACRFHTAVVQNLFFSVSEKNRGLEKKIDHLSRRTTREKLISYLSEEAKRNRRSSFEIPFNRQQLADYLSVDRSAMSAELSKMRDEGLISFEKNRFELFEQ